MRLNERAGKALALEHYLTAAQLLDQAVSFTPSPEGAQALLDRAADARTRAKQDTRKARRG